MQLCEVGDVGVVCFVGWQCCWFFGCCGDLCVWCQDDFVVFEVCVYVEVEFFVCIGECWIDVQCVMDFVVDEYVLYVGVEGIVYVIVLVLVEFIGSQFD